MNLTTEQIGGIVAALEPGLSAGRRLHLQEALEACAKCDIGMARADAADIALKALRRMGIGAVVSDGGWDCFRRPCLWPEVTCQLVHKDFYIMTSHEDRSTATLMAVAEFAGVALDLEDCAHRLRGIAIDEMEEDE